MAEVASWNVRTQSAAKYKIATPSQQHRLNIHKTTCVCVCIHLCVHACRISMYIFRYRYVSVGATDSAGLIHCCRQGSLTHTSIGAKSAPYLSQRHLFAKTAGLSVVLLSPTPTIFLIPQHHIFCVLLDVTQLPNFLSPHNLFSFPTPHTSQNVWIINPL